MKKTQLQVGLDISQKRLDACLMRGDGQLLVAHRRFSNDLEGYEGLKALVVEVLETEGMDRVALAGESTSYYWLPLYLQLQAEESWQAYDPQLYLLNPRQLHWFKKAYAPDDKTDARDSFYIAEKVRTQQQRLHPWQCDAQWLRLRFYSRLRFHIGHLLTREKNYFWSHMFLKGSAYRSGQPFGDCLGVTGRQLVRNYPHWRALLDMTTAELSEQLATWSKQRLPDPADNARRLRQTVARSYPLAPELEEVVQDLLVLTLDRIALLEQQAAQVERLLQQEVDEHHPEVNHLVNIKGLGIVLAAGIAAEIGDLQRFFEGQKEDRRKGRRRPKNLRDVEDAVAKLAGLWWPRHASGGFEGQERRLSKKGNRFLRYYLVEAADKLRQHQPQYQAYYQRKYRETKKYQHKRALVLTARKSVGLFVGLLHRNEPYRPPEVNG